MNDQLTLGDVAMGKRGTPAVLVVLVDGKHTATSYLDGPRCLNHVAALAKCIAPDVEIAMYFGHTTMKWKGRGLRGKRSTSPLSTTEKP